MSNRRYILIALLALLSQYSVAQFQYHFNQDIPVVQDEKLSGMAWAGGLNAGQYNVIDLDNDGIDDLIIFERDNNKILTFLADNGQYKYSPEYEHLFPDGLDQWVLLRDYNCDGKVDLFTSSIFGMSLYENISVSGGQLAWEIVYETVFTEGSNGQVNLQVSGLDLPGISDVDGDGDLDVFAFNFAVGGGVHFHKNMSVERTGNCGLDLVRITERYGEFEECSCVEYVFGTDACNTGGRLQHSGGKSIVSYPYSGQQEQDLLIGQEACSFGGYLQNSGTVEEPKMISVDFNFPNSTNPIELDYPAIFNIDLNFDGEIDLLAANNSFVIDANRDYSKNNWYYQKSASGYALVTKSFLQEDMIDIGYAASPALADIDGDGDEELLLGSGSQSNGARLVLYENDGDALSPRLIKMDADYLNLSTASYEKISPQFIDVNKDGRLDLLIKKVINGQQFIDVYWHTNNSLQPYDPANLRAIYPPILGIHDNPYFYFSGDKLSILVGRNTGRLSKFINQGSIENPQWELVDDAFLGIIDDYRARNISVSIADLDGDGKNDLLRYDDSGMLRIYSNYNDTAELKENIIQDTQTLAGYNSSFGNDANITVSFITGSKLPSIIMGLKSGGVQILSNIEDEQQDVDLDIKVALFPNPVDFNKILSLVANQDVEIILYDVWGHPLSGKMKLAKGTREELDLTALRSGLYLIAVQNNQGNKSSFKFVLTD